MILLLPHIGVLLERASPSADPGPLVASENKPVVVVLASDIVFLQSWLALNLRSCLSFWGGGIT